MICARMYQAIDAEGKREKNRIGLFRCRKMSFREFLGEAEASICPPKEMR